MAHVSTSFPFTVGQHFIVQVYRTLFIHSSAYLVLHMISHSVPGIPEVHPRGPDVGGLSSGWLRKRVGPSEGGFPTLMYVLMGSGLITIWERQDVSARRAFLGE